jgi:hypothetical protein
MITIELVNLEQEGRMGKIKLFFVGNATKKK